jgi:hypothetical protein
MGRRTLTMRSDLAMLIESTEQAVPTADLVETVYTYKDFRRARFHPTLHHFNVI